ncbi:MAG: hypothetical protein ACM3YN_07465 [Parcubacteria group bacterium]
MTIKNILTAYGDWYHRRNGIAVTFVANQDWSKSTFESRLKTFHETVDRRRLGGRFYSKQADVRLDFMVAPEMFGCGHPHYHGFLSLPDDDLAKYGRDGTMRLYEATWRMLTPSGSLLCADLIPDKLGTWAEYCSKENDLAECPDTIWSRARFVGNR